MSLELFKKYLDKDPNFTGFLNYNIFKTLENNNSLSEYFGLVSWYNKKENQNSIQDAISEKSIDLKLNISVADKFVRNYRSKLVKKQPSLSSFEYLGMFHEY